MKVTTFRDADPNKPNCRAHPRALRGPAALHSQAPAPSTEEAEPAAAASPIAPPAASTAQNGGRGAASAGPAGRAMAARPAPHCARPALPQGSALPQGPAPPHPGLTPAASLTNRLLGNPPTRKDGPKLLIKTAREQCGGTPLLLDLQLVHPCIYMESLLKSPYSLGP